MTSRGPRKQLPPHTGSCIPLAFITPGAGSHTDCCEYTGRTLTNGLGFLLSPPRHARRQQRAPQGEVTRGRRFHSTGVTSFHPRLLPRLLLATTNWQGTQLKSTITAVIKDPFNLGDYFTAAEKTSIISKIIPRQFLL